MSGVHGGQELFVMRQELIRTNGLICPFSSNDQRPAKNGGQELFVMWQELIRTKGLIFPFSFNDPRPAKIIIRREAGA